MNKITVVPLGDNLLRRVAEDIAARFYAADDPLSLAGVTVVVPHRRGIVYLRHYLAEVIAEAAGGGPLARPMLLPRMATIEEFVTELAVAAEDRPGRALDSADQAWLLFRLVKDLGLYQNVAGSWDRFFGWGVRLAGLLDEIDREMIDPTDVYYPEDVPDQARVLLARLRSIYDGFVAALDREGFTTQARRFRKAAEAIGGSRAGSGLGTTPVPTYLVGFYATSRSEDRIFRHLFEGGASIWWHADPDDLPPLYRRWQEAWKAETMTAGESRSLRPRLVFHEAYDLHAELRTVRAVLAEGTPDLPDQTALVLPDPSALVPTLYHLPVATEINVSLGYPLARSSIAALFEQAMVLEEGKGKEGGYYHQDYLTLLRHPYVRRLPTPAGKDGRIVLHLLESKARQYGRPFLTQADIRDLLALAYGEERDRNLLTGEGISLEEAVAHLDQMHARLLKPWQMVRSPRDLAAALRKIVAYLLAPMLERPQAGAELALDSEFLHALAEQVIPSLEDALFAGETMSRGLLFSLLRDLVAMTRVPFEGEPLRGLQVLGLLETRLLSFDRVIMIDVNEGVVPAHDDVNPLLPDPLRPAVGLPTKEKEEAITRYHFERLVGSAREVHLVWQASTTPSASGLEGKKARSRFVEALLWGEETRAGRLLDDAIEHQVLAIPPQALVRSDGLAKTEAESAAVAEFVKTQAAGQGVSATMLNTYLRCPLEFLYNYILDLSVPASPLEEVDSADLGVMVHKALEAYFKPLLGKSFARARDGDPDRLVSLFTDIYSQSPMFRSLGPEKRVFLESAVAHRLRTYVEALPEETLIENLEQRLTATLPTSLGPLKFAGKVDRIDRREGKRIVLDYKTGSVRVPNVSHFEKVLVDLSPPTEFDYAGLAQVREALADLQLPLYVMLVAAAGSQSGGSAPAGGAKGKRGRSGIDAADILSAYVELRAPGVEGHKERYFVRPDKADELRDAYAAWFAETFPGILAYVVDHMAQSPCFYRATDEADCGWCDYEAVCSLAFA
jgi:ATP-dependent helicase/nuclease subunit B